MKKITKGQFGYLNNERKRVIIRTILFFVLSIALFCVGYFTSGTKKNILTIIAVLGMLPASKSAVNMIMFFRAKPSLQATEVFEQIKTHVHDLPIIYDLYMTSYDKNFPINALFVRNNTVVAFTDNEKCVTAMGDKHIDSMLKQNSLKTTVKIFNQAELSKFVERMDVLSEKEEENQDNVDAILGVILSISL